MGMKKMRIKLSGWQRIGIVLNAIYLIIIIFIAWNNWPMPLPNLKLVTDPNLIKQLDRTEPIDLLQGQGPTKGDIFDQIAEKPLPNPNDIIVLPNQGQPRDLFLEANLQYKKALRIERLKIIGVAFMAWIIPSASVYLLGFSISKSKKFFKNIRVGIILIFVGIFIPTFFYPFLKPIPINELGKREYIKREMQGKEIHYKLNELEVVLIGARYYSPRFAIPYKYFVASGIVLVFIGTGICVLNKDKKTTTTQKDNSIVT
ncbi:MAG: hypothetical protein A2W74_03795 [Planctomycetes bacterium RIFCSPLOWO2_12_38_17]|nr:MAG: hypothetical protein A2W74_03795 [Planctomycetes bacterium RIFCSPLOWO2_12_38_17]